jgi:hypothetical protein
MKKKRGRKKIFLSSPRIAEGTETYVDIARRALTTNPPR